MWNFPQSYLKFLHVLEKFESFIANSKFIRIGKRIGLFSFVPVVILSYAKYNTNLENDQLKIENTFLRTENVIIKEKSIGIYRSFDDVPFAMWTKLKVYGEERFIMLRTNQAYYDKILKNLRLSINAYIGSSDVDIYPKKIADKFLREDLYVARTGKTTYVFDQFVDSLKNSHRLMVFKWRKIEKLDTLVMGIALDLDQPMMKQLMDLKNNKMELPKEIEDMIIKELTESKNDKSTGISER